MMVMIIDLLLINEGVPPLPQLIPGIHHSVGKIVIFFGGEREIKYIFWGGRV